VSDSAPIGYLWAIQTSAGAGVNHPLSYRTVRDARDAWPELTDPGAVLCELRPVGGDPSEPSDALADLSDLRADVEALRDKEQGKLGVDTTHGESKEVSAATAAYQAVLDLIIKQREQQ
jgi:hypothetical protein